MDAHISRLLDERAGTPAAAVEIASRGAGSLHEHDAAPGEGASTPRVAGPATYGFWDGASLYRVLRDARGTAVLERLSRVEHGSRLERPVERESDGTSRERADVSTLEPGRLWEVLPHTRPVAFGAKATRTIGTGDRLGLAGHAHAGAFRTRDARPVLAQQSVRELTQTRRGYGDVATAAALGALEAGYSDGFGFDGDHLKTLEEVRAAHDAGCSMLTLDLSGVLDPLGVRGGAAEVAAAWSRLPESVRTHWSTHYADRHVSVGGINLHLGTEEVRRTAVTFVAGLAFVEEVAALLSDRAGRPIDLEVSVDETGVDTSAAQHFILAAELERRGVPMTSLAPKFVGEFQKGIDYIGDEAALHADLAMHAAIASGMAGGYRLSLHSGSDKYTLFPLVETACDGRYHLKTSGTFWLEALRAVALSCPETFERIFALAWERFEEMRSLYELHAERERIVTLQQRDKSAYGRYFEERDARQLLHVCYGAVLRDQRAAAALSDCLARERTRYLELVTAHLERHLDALRVPAR